MVHLIRNNTPYAVLLLLIFALLTQGGVLLHPVAPVARPDEQVYGWVLHLFNSVLRGNAMAWTVVSFLLLFAQALYLNRVALHHKLFSKPTYVPAYLLLVYAAFSPAFAPFSPVLVVNFIGIGALDAMLQFGHPSQPRRQIFNAAFLVATAALVQFSAVFYLLLLVMALLLLRPFHPGEWVTALLGLVTPIYFFAGLLFLTDRLPLLRQWPALGLNLPRHVAHPVPLLGAIGGVTVLMLAGLYTLQEQMRRTTIFVRRAWGAVVSGMIAALLVAVFAASAPAAAWWAMAPGFALVAAPTFAVEKPRRVATFIFWFSVALVLLCQMAA